MDNVKHVFEELLKAYVLEFGQEQGSKELAFELDTIARKAFSRLLSKIN